MKIKWPNQTDGHKPGRPRNPYLERVFEPTQEQRNVVKLLPATAFRSAASSRLCAIRIRAGRSRSRRCRNISPTSWKAALRKWTGGTRQFGDCPIKRLAACRRGHQKAHGMREWQGPSPKVRRATGRVRGDDRELFRGEKRTISAKRRSGLD